MVMSGGMMVIVVAVDADGVEIEVGVENQN